MDDECKFFESDTPQDSSEIKTKDFNNDYDYRCPHCGSAEKLVYLDHILGCNYIIFSCDSCSIGFMAEDLVAGFFIHKLERLKEKYSKK